MVLCLKSAEAVTHIIMGDDKDEFDWFPDSFLITEERLSKGKFKGRQGMKAPPEVALADGNP